MYRMSELYKHTWSDVIVKYFLILGLCHMFGCVAEKIFVMKVMPEDTHKLQAVKCSVSLDGDFLGLVLESMYPIYEKLYIILIYR